MAEAIRNGGKASVGKVMNGTVMAVEMRGEIKAISRWLAVFCGQKGGRGTVTEQVVKL